MPEPDEPYRLWARGTNRYAVTPKEAAVPVLGFVRLETGSKLWIIERSGKVLRLGYDSPQEAAQALIELDKLARL